MEKRSQTISDKFTPSENVSQKARTKKQEVERPIKRKQIEI